MASVPPLVKDVSAMRSCHEWCTYTYCLLESYATSVLVIYLSESCSSSCGSTGGVQRQRRVGKWVLSSGPEMCPGVPE